MLCTIRAVVRDGKIELLEPISLMEGVHVLVTVLADEEQSFWQAANSSSFERVWNNDEDDIYAELLAP